MSDKEFVDAVIKMYDDYVDDAFYTEEEFMDNIWNLIFKYECNQQHSCGK